MSSEQPMNYERDELVDDDDDDLVEEEQSWDKSVSLPTQEVSDEEFSIWCKPYLNFLIVKLMGRFLGVGFMK